MVCWTSGDGHNIIRRVWEEVDNLIMIVIDGNNSIQGCVWKKIDFMNHPVTESVLHVSWCNILYTTLWLLLCPSKVLVHTIQSFSCCNWRMVVRQYELCCNNQLTRRVLRHTQIAVFHLLSLTINSSDEEVACGGGRERVESRVALRRWWGAERELQLRCSCRTTIWMAALAMIGRPNPKS